MSTLDEYKADKGDNNEVIALYYHHFLDATDYEVIKAMERNKDVDTSLKECRQYARDVINQMEGGNE